MEKKSYVAKWPPHFDEENSVGFSLWPDPDGMGVAAINRKIS